MSRRIDSRVVSASCVSSSPSIAATCALMASPEGIAFPEKNSQRGENCPRYARAAQLLFGRLGLLVDCRLGDFGERLVRGLFLIKRFLKQFDGVIQTELFRPGL
jgi:hypothetical protein